MRRQASPESSFSRVPAEARHQRIALINTTIGAFMSSLDGSILTVSLPTIARDLHTGVALMLWIMMGYTVVITALLLPLGRLSDTHGRVRMYGVGFIIFAASSALCGFSQSGAFLLGSRLIQGVGAAMLWCNSQAIVTDAFPSRGRGFALGINQMAGLSGSVFGLVLGGIITAALGWRWIFFVNLPVGAFGAIWTFTALKEIATIDRGEPFDTWGMVLFVGGILFALLGLTFIIQGESRDWTFAAAAACLVAFVIYERSQRYPLVDLRLFRIRLFTFGNTSLLLNALARGALMFLVTFSFQGLRGASPLTAGVMMLPLSFAIMIVGPISGRLSDRMGSRELSSGGLLVTCVSLAMLARIPLTGPYLPIAFALLLAGIGNGLFNSPNTSAVMGSVPPDRRGVASSTRTLLFNAGQLFSMAMSFTILSTAMGAGRLSGFLAGVDVSSAAIGHEAFAHGLTEAFTVSTVLSFIAAILSYMRGRAVPAVPDQRAS